MQEWRADPKPARWHPALPPHELQLVDLVERWFKELTDRRLRRGTFARVAALIDAIDTGRARDRRPQAFIGPKTADEIVARMGRGGPWKLLSPTLDRATQD